MNEIDGIFSASGETGRAGDDAQIGSAAFDGAALAWGGISEWLFDGDKVRRVRRYGDCRWLSPFHPGSISSRFHFVTIAAPWGGGFSFFCNLSGIDCVLPVKMKLCRMKTI